MHMLTKKKPTLLSKMYAIPVINAIPRSLYKYSVNNTVIHRAVVSLNPHNVIIYVHERDSQIKRNITGRRNITEQYIGRK